MKLRTQSPATGAIEVTDILIRFTATDGTPLEGKLTVPAEAKGPVPVMFHLHGAGPRNYDNAVPYRDGDGRVQVYDFCCRQQKPYFVAIPVMWRIIECAISELHSRS